MLVAPYAGKFLGLSSAQFGLSRSGRTLTAMTEDSPDAELDEEALRALLDRRLTELSLDELMALKAVYEARGTPIYNSIALEVVAAVMTTAAIYSKAFLETLAQHDAEALRDALRTRIRKAGKTREVYVGPEDGSAAILVVTSETPDEARLALLDMDVTAEEVRGKMLRWDNAAMVWRPDSIDD